MVLTYISSHFTIFMIISRLTACYIANKDQLRNEQKSAGLLKPSTGYMLQTLKY